MKLKLPSLPIAPTRAPAAREALLDHLAGKIRNPNTRAAYLYGWRHFLGFCHEKGLTLEVVREAHVGAWLEIHSGSKRTQRQHLAAVRALFRALVFRQVLAYNPAADVKGPRLRDPRSRTPVFEPDEATQFFDAFHGFTLKDQRDLALVRVFFHHCCRVSALVNLKVSDYSLKAGRRWLCLEEKGGKRHDLPVHAKAQAALDVWLANSGLSNRPCAPLFSSFNRDRETPTGLKMNRRSVYRLVGRLVRRAGIAKRIGCHSFRATGITFFRMNGGSLEDASRLANHASINTTKIYDRTFDGVLIRGIERVDVPEGKA